MALISDSVRTLANPPLPLDPAQVKQDVEVLKIYTTYAALPVAPPGLLAAAGYVEGDSPAVVKLKLRKMEVEAFLTIVSTP
jgi:hypothetical protein